MKTLVKIITDNPLGHYAIMLVVFVVDFLLWNSNEMFNLEEMTRSQFALIQLIVHFMYMGFWLFWLVLFATAFLRQGFRRKLLWLGSFAAITASFVLFYVLNRQYHFDNFMTRDDEWLSWTLKSNWRVFTQFYLLHIGICVMFAWQCASCFIERRLRKLYGVCNGGEENAEPDVCRADRKRRILNGARIVIGMVVGIALFFVARRVCVYVDHAHDATTGPYSYYGFPLPVNIGGPEVSTFSAIYSAKLQRMCFNLLFWCSCVWMLLFSPDIVRYIKVRGRRAVAFLSVLCLAIVVAGTAAFIFRDAVGYHWYWGDDMFWEYRRSVVQPDFPWWQWVLIYL